MNSFDKILEHEIDSANEHLPAKKVALREIVESGNLSYPTKGGEISSFRQEEIELLVKMVPEHLHGEIKLPIVILRRMDLGTGIFSVAGGKVELFLVFRIIQDSDAIEWDDFTFWTPIERYARLQIQILRRKLPSTTTIGFTLTPSEDNKKNGL